ncbi:hypothetical protein [Leptospira dzoumogneensis]|uniref:Uncharacterized protein n=1 Tax=Leptospira dzoumogneensis TaxID=2484904 RepID=A0A4Z1AYW5_9LEPT|nr:hypothetical protein [Leptospira dzoumogneensis]TGN03036.1 hypothetical protein EHR06_03235 [Leptospira dzoumogneensis]
MVLRGKKLRFVSASLALFTLLFFIHSGPSNSPYPGKKSDQSQIIIGQETDIEELSDLAETSDPSETVWGDSLTSEINTPGLSDSNPSRQDRFQFQHNKLLSQHLLNIPPPSIS